MIPISTEEGYDLERWLGQERYRRLGLHEVVGWRKPLPRAPLWLLIIANSRRNVFQAAVERYDALGLMRGDEAVSRAQLALLDLVDQAALDPELGAYIEGLVRLGGGRAVFSLIDARCRMDVDLIKRAHAERNVYRTPA